MGAGCEAGLPGSGGGGCSGAEDWVGSRSSRACGLCRANWLPLFLGALESRVRRWGSPRPAQPHSLTPGPGWSGSQWPGLQLSAAWVLPLSCSTSMASCSEPVHHKSIFSWRFLLTADCPPLNISLSSSLLSAPEKQKGDAVGVPRSSGLSLPALPLSLCCPEHSPACASVSCGPEHLKLVSPSSLCDLHL